MVKLGDTIPAMHRRSFLESLAAMAAAPWLHGHAGASGLQSAPRTSALELWYPRAARQWVEALPIGNGRLGGMVFGGVAVDRVSLNDDTLWSGGPRAWDNPGARETSARDSTR